MEQVMGFGQQPWGIFKDMGTVSLLFSYLKALSSNQTPADVQRDDKFKEKPT